MKHTKLIVSWIILGAAAALMAGCGMMENGVPDSGTQVPTAAESVQESTPPEQTAAEESTSAETVTETSAPVPAADENGYADIYAPVFQEYFGAIWNGYDSEKEYSYLGNGMMEVIMYEEPEQLVQEMGYLITDISGDGIPELLIGRNEPGGYGGEEQYSTIFSCFTCRDGAPVLTFEGWSRSRHCWIGDGKFSFLGSGGAMFTALGTHHLSEDGTEVAWDDFYFTDEKSDGECGYYHNTTGIWEAAQAEELTISGEDFWKFGEHSSYELLSWTPLADAPGADDHAALGVRWDKYGTASDYDLSYEPETSGEYTVHVAFTALEPVKNLRIVELFVKNVDADGNLELLYEDRFKAGDLTKGMTLLAGMEFNGTFPSNGFVYTDENGNDRLFVLEESGRDGSLSVWEYK